ncbi:indole-3-glycerol phosphate synthase TrpC [Limnovirga soli]|uniref:indole-3-glycerol-phosphate synthase n=1 Tax=Limnovirga soli TaxID=2656915 RepID=A0A8J8FAN4_9BACT|nr:indole-3-glycerol phosphate synthase TrpC [Limnovirga soli]NNV54570.1 indole-3-glycerol phosphate synthase TrpC [Limnovirga soli]
MNILETIVAQKHIEVAERKAVKGIDALEQEPFFARPTLSLRSFLLDDTKTGIIAEFKRKSPSKGVINVVADVVTVTGAYSTHGASGLSVLTDELFFGGSTADLLQARVHATPILRKDFMIDAYQFYEAKAMGADVVLLIAACLTVKQVQEFAILAKSLGLEVLLEIHNHEELAHICDEVDFVGVNNRNLKTFEVDINTSLQLFPHIPANKLAIAESGISNTDTIITLKQAGFKGFLIGENFMKQPNPTIAFADFVHQLQSHSKVG